MPPLTPRSMRRCWTPVASSELQRSRPGLATHQQANLEAPSCRRQSSGSSRAASRLIRHWSSATLPVQCTATPTLSAVVPFAFRCFSKGYQKRGSNGVQYTVERCYTPLSSDSHKTMPACSSVPNAMHPGHESSFGHQLEVHMV
ncbi:hypothetical protein VPH35_082047 [Triticum aestivum]